MGKEHKELGLTVLKNVLWGHQIEPKAFWDCLPQKLQQL